MRNRLFTATPVASLTMAKAASKNPFIKSFVMALYAIGTVATKSVQILTEDDCIKQNVSRDNVGLALERFDHRILYSASKGQVQDTDLQAFCEALAQSVDEEDVIFVRDQETIADKDTFDFALTVQFNATHRMTIRRNKFKVDETTDKSTGETVVRNPFGWELSLIPNEYVSKKVVSDQPLPAVEVAWPTV